MYKKVIFNCKNYIKQRSVYSWIPPAGTDSGIKLYNPITKTKVPLVFKNPELIKWYICGPTVYDSTHIGHASAYVRLDILRRILQKWYNLRPLITINITDIDDKILKRAAETNQNYKELAKKYELEFFSQMHKFNVMPADFIVRVSENVDLIIKFVDELISKGFAYTVPDGSVYFDTNSFPNYGKVTRTPQPTLNEGEKRGVKRHPADFALWKSAKPGEPCWKTTWAKDEGGRPGWHIECSAMASNIFGDNIDIHAGGLDLAFPHHENEEAQSCAFHNTSQWVDYWIHVGHLLMNGMKMSKSMKNFVTIDDYLKEYTSDQFRMLCLLTNYRYGIDFTPDVMKKAVRLEEKFQNFVQDARNYQTGLWNKGEVSAPILLQALTEAKKNVKLFLSDDFNTARVVELLEDLMKKANLMLQSNNELIVSRECASIASVANFIEDSLQTFGLFPSNTFKHSTDMDYVIDKSIEFRRNIRDIAYKLDGKEEKAQLFKLSDNFRSQLASVGVQVKDIDKNQSTWSYSQNKT